VNSDIWSQQDTTPDAIEAAMRELLRVRHAANERLAPARVLNLVVIVDREWKGEIANRLERAGRYHGSRTILCTVEEGRTKLDAVATVSYDNPDDKLGVIWERVELDLGPGHLEALQTIIDPIVVAGIPTVCWSPHGHDDAVRSLLPLIDVLMVDSDDFPSAAEAFDRVLALGAHAYVIDLAWLRTTPWRERLAASFDLPSRAPALAHVAELDIRHRDGSSASALLLAGWLASRLQWQPVELDLFPGDRREARLVRGEEEVRIIVREAHQEAPGLAAVTVDCRPDLSLSLERGRGGLDAVERMPDGETQHWKILGASREEGGILGDGIRQALLREPTYWPALHAARTMATAP
jgi:glucose-6-phosphate dehydrogenase assembly protein OpcA